MALYRTSGGLSSYSQVRPRSLFACYCSAFHYFPAEKADLTVESDIRGYSLPFISKKAKENVEKLVGSSLFLSGVILVDFNRLTIWVRSFLTLYYAGIYTMGSTRTSVSSRGTR
jgi:hypothetical protein